jgi:WD40 repeat protein
MARDYIFVSYSHRDEEWLELLRIFLKPFPWAQSYKAGGRLWADPYIQVGDRWRREIGDGLARTRIAVLLVSQDFLASDFIAGHELPPLLAAAASGEIVIVCVPVRTSVVDLARPELLTYQWPRPHDEPLDLLGPAEREGAFAKVFRSFHDVVKSAGMTEAVATITVPAPRLEAEAGVDARRLIPGNVPGRLFGVPAQRPHHIPRLDVRDRLRGALLSGPGDSVGITGLHSGAASGRVGVFGQGGLGKTVSAIDLVHDEDVRRAFPDGIYWLTFGQTPDIASLQSSLIQKLTGAPSVVDSVVSGSGQIRELLAERACLLVLDDVWRYEHARAFDVVGARGRVLATTRDGGVLTALGAESIELDVLSEPQALELLATWVLLPVADLPEASRTVVRRCGYLPLAISVAGAMVRDGTDWTDLLAALEAGNLRFLDHPYASVFTSLRLSLDALPERLRTRYVELAVVPEDVAMPVSVVGRMWAHTAHMKEYESRQVLADLDKKGLLYLEGQGRTASVRFHDLQRDFLQLAADDVRKLHATLLDAFAATLGPPTSETHRAWWTLPADERYLWRHLGHHLSRADRRDELRQLLLAYDWISAKLGTTDINALLSDFDALAGDRAGRVLQGALRLSAHVLAKDHAQLAGQIVGRLLQAPESEVRELVSRARAGTSVPWLRPLTASLTPPGGALVRTLAGHAYSVNDVALTANGQRAVSASGDNTLKVWDLTTATVLHTLEGHAHWVNAVAVTPDGQRAVSASADNTLKVWDLTTAAVLHTLEGHADSVNGVAVTPDGLRAVSASADGTLKVWDLTAGAVLHILEGHTDSVNAIAVTPDGQRAVSASGDDTLKVWDLTSGAVLHTLEGHMDSVNAIAVTPDGRRAVSASDDKTLKVWDLMSGAVLHTLEGHADSVNAIAVTPDGRRAVSASDDKTLKVWDLTTCAVLQTLEGHAYSVNAVAVMPDGLRAVSASDDSALKIWDLTTSAVLQTLESHSDWVNAVAVTPDGQRAVSASDDNTLKVWDLATGAVLRTLEGHAGSVNGASVTPDGLRAVSASEDNTLKVWDLATGAVMHTLEGHADWVNAVAVTPDGLRAVSASEDDTLKVWDLTTGAVMHTLEGHADSVNGVSVTPDGLRAVSASEDNTLKVWDLTTRAVLLTLEGHADSVNAVAMTPDGQRAVSASDDNTVRVWDLATGAVVATFVADGSAYACAVAPDGATVVAGDALGRVHFLHLENA